MKLPKLSVERILFFLFLALLVFIPLYPKIPLFSPIEDYIVRVRLEDILVLFTSFYLAIVLVLRKAKIDLTMLGLISLYIAVGATSLFSAVFVLGTIPQQSLHVSKSLLHLFRYIEYFSLFFIGVAAVNRLKQTKIVVYLLAAIVTIASLYGIGQRYLGFPVYSTMNREYSKGLRLYLDSEFARVPSTFAGHYDFGSYLVLILPIILAWIFLSTSKKERSIGLVIYAFGLWGLVSSASRSAFIATFGALGLVILLVSFYLPDWKQKLKSIIRKGVQAYGLMFLIFILFGGNIFQLFLSSLENFRPRVSTQEQSGPPDVYVDVPETVEVVTIDENGEERVRYQEQPRTFSECAQTRGLSLCIRLEALWPQAWDGFQLNPLLGTGYATLNKKSLFHFSEADGTDNNYLRILGETGVLGLGTFFLIIFYALYQTSKLYLNTLKRKIFPREKNHYAKALIIGYFAGAIGLLVNAIYIDVYAASKVAFSFWAMTGVIMAISSNLTSKKAKN